MKNKEKYVIKFIHIPFNDYFYVINIKKLTEDKNDNRVKIFNSKLLAHLYCLYLKINYLKDYKYYNYKVERK